MTKPADAEALAFEYVLGTLSVAERAEVEQQMRTDVALERAVRYWEASLMPAPESLPELEPLPDTLSQIQAHVQSQEQTRHEPAAADTRSQRPSFWQNLFAWRLTSAVVFSMLLMVSAVLLKHELSVAPTPNADYVAVLVNEGNEPVLTALTASDGSKLWLKWSDLNIPQGRSFQLWSQSRRDGEIRPLVVFENTDGEAIELDQATWRLIKDSSHLLITLEESGGSPLDEPSEEVVAKGACVRLVDTAPVPEAGEQHG